MITGKGRINNGFQHPFQCKKEFTRPAAGATKDFLKKILHQENSLIFSALLVARKVGRTALFADR